MRRIPLTSFPFLAGLLLIVSAASFAGERERSRLAQLAKEIDYLIQQVDTIQTDADTSGDSRERIVFRYTDLVRDLTLVKEGISDYIDAELRDGKSVHALDGRYR